MDVEIGEVVSTVRAIDGDALLSPREDAAASSTRVLARVRDERDAHSRARAAPSAQIDGGRGDVDAEERDVEQLAEGHARRDVARRAWSSSRVQFNPTEFSLDKAAQIAEIAIPGLDAPLLQFVRGQARS